MLRLQISGANRMKMHKNARLTPRGRERLVRQFASGQTPEAVAEAAGICPRTVRKWVDRYCREGLAGLQDRSSRPHRLGQPTPQLVVKEVERRRRQRWTGKQIAAETGVSPATVSRILRRLGLSSSAPLSQPNRSGAMSVKSPANSFISISKARPHRLRGTSHRRPIPWRGQPSSRHRLGIGPCLHRRRLTHRLRAAQARSAQGKCRRLPGGLDRLLRQVRHQG